MKTFFKLLALSIGIGLLAFVAFIAFAVHVTQGAFGQVAGALSPDSVITDQVAHDWVGWQVRYLCDNSGARLASWLDWIGSVLVVPVMAQLLRNFRVWFPGIDSNRLLQIAALHFFNPPVSGNTPANPQQGQ